MPDVPVNVLISIGGILFAAVGAWFAVKGKVQALEEHVQQVEVDIASQDKIDVDLIEKMTELKIEVKYLRRDLVELRDKVGKG